MADCPYEDPFCPCQDGDACHYEDMIDEKGRIVSKGIEPPKHKEWKDLPIVTQSAIRCADQAFWRFLDANGQANEDGSAIGNKDNAASVVRLLCGITSRRELATNDKAAEIFRRLDEDFGRWNKW